jgi:hypothetical protein
VLVTEPPKFRVVAGCLHCELVSGTRTHVFCISKHDTQIALEECAEVFTKWGAEGSNVCDMADHRHD